MSNQMNMEHLQVVQAKRELNRLTEMAIRTESRHASDLLVCQNLMAEPSLSLVFGGHFKSGKSTLLNTLIGKNLLPTSRLPETGVPCVLSRARTEGIKVFRHDRAESIPFTTDGIKQLSSLLTIDGQRRDKSLDVQRIEVKAPWFPMAFGVNWIDAPGYNDTKEMDDSLLKAARSADLLVWVLHSQQSISEVEVDFLSQFVSERGPDSLLFVINVFLGQDSQEEWQNYLDLYHPHVIQRVRDRENLIGFRSGSRARIIPIAARAQGRFQEQSFGGNSLRVALTDISGLQHPLCVVSRASRGKLTLDSVSQACHKELKSLRQEHQDYKQCEEKKVEQRREIRVKALREVNDAIRAFWSCWPKVETAVINKIDYLNFDSTYSILESELNEQFKANLKDDLIQLQLRLKVLQSQYDHSGSKVDLIERYISNIELKANLPLKPKLPNCESGSEGKVIATTIGWFLGPIGALGGLALGSVIDAARQENAKQEALTLKVEWRGTSVTRIRGDLDNARQQMEIGFERVRHDVEHVWLPDLTPQVDRGLDSKIKKVEEMEICAQEIAHKFDLRLWRIVITKWFDAKQVAISGTFNNWDPSSQPLRKSVDGYWWCEIVLSTGKHSYKFLVDGEWHLDPTNSMTLQNGNIINNVVSIS